MSAEHLYPGISDQDSKHTPEYLRTERTYLLSQQRIAIMAGDALRSMNNYVQNLLIDACGAGQRPAPSASRSF